MGGSRNREENRKSETHTHILSFLISHFCPVCVTGRSEGDVEICSISDRESDVVRFILKKIVFSSCRSICALWVAVDIAQQAARCCVFPVSGKKIESGGIRVKAWWYQRLVRKNDAGS